MALTGIQSAAAGDRITVTTNPKMHRIMRHEFSTGAAFDPGPLHKYLATLTREQVRLLMTYAKDKYAGRHRLVVFVTLDPAGTRKLMCADLCDGGSTSVESNARFAVFWCNGESGKVELVCYTEELLLNAGRPRFARANSEKPTVYKISAMDMTGIAGEGDVIWHRVSSLGPNGQGIAIYGGRPYLDPATNRKVVPAPNAMHGMINTVGCWMLFRNYNWYTPKRDELMKVFLKFRKDRKWSSKCSQELQALGYGELGDDNLSNRFLYLERNYAYLWFTHDVIGVEYFSKDDSVNTTNIDGSKLLTTFGQPAAPTSDNAYDFWEKRKSDGRFKFENSLWIDNALGFKAARKFSPFQGHITLDIEESSWADLYAYSL